MPAEFHESQNVVLNGFRAIQPDRTHGQLFHSCPDFSFCRRRTGSVRPSKSGNIRHDRKRCVLGAGILLDEPVAHQEVLCHRTSESPVHGTGVQSIQSPEPGATECLHRLRRQRRAHHRHRRLAGRNFDAANTIRSSSSILNPGRGESRKSNRAPFRGSFDVPRSN